MSPLIQIRDVPDDVHRRLKARAAEDGRTLSDYVLGELAEIARRPTLAEMRERLAAREPVPLPPGAAADAIRSGRERADG